MLLGSNLIIFVLGVLCGLFAFRLFQKKDSPQTSEPMPVVKPPPSVIVRDDVADEKNKLKQVQVDKYSVLRDLGAGVSHEINNPLAIILGKVQMMKLRFEREKDKGEVTRKDILETFDKIETNAKRISKIVLALRLMTKDSTNEESSYISVAGIFEDLTSVWGERLKNKGYKFELSQIDPAVEIYGKRSLLVTALFNMVSNSFDATQELTERWIKIEAQSQNGNLTMAITDAGNGIPEETRTRLFDPFFTTRDAATSSGLGLAVAKGIFEVHRGTIEYDASSPNTKFIVNIPLTGMLTKKAS